ncbi:MULTISPECIES: hypothetical protein [Pectobacterium]|uniref:hypothetical protein n=1 Tax=Pectobacterium TaxID=122277 RepID=UPI001B3882C9|nr:MULTISPECIES: hypothetical protein [Pectobacterium]MBQ4791337.1 hypothetical protein [Pectobacterium versatile]GKV83372.1 hypothetical protein PEC106664_41460 [Pectobacterium carotovorum subsp. carotovorum]GKW39622.1 hypothetical protein PEC301875_36460 [Pectobacterium carotovorum subsp. carotovorum]
MLEINSMIELLAKEWVKLYKVRPVVTSLLTVALAAILATGITYLDHVDREKRENKRLENLDYQNQIQQLDQMETNVKQLLAFVDNQKKTLQETEDTISNLKSEREKLQPLVETDRAVVEALFKAQEDRANANVWRERWIGFGFGVAASLIASFIWFVVSMLVKGRHNKLMQPTTDVSAD